MKKILNILVILVLFGFVPVVNAANFSSFKVSTSFSNDIDVQQIPAIYVLIAVPGEEDFREIELTRENLFNYETKDMPNSNIEFDSAYIAGDRYGKYILSGELKRNDTLNMASLVVTVLENNGKNTTTSKTTTTAVTTSGSSTVSGSDDVIVIDDNGKVQTTSAETITITTKTEISEKAKARLHLYKYIFIGVAVLLAVVGFIILVKVVRTSNLM